MPYKHIFLIKGYTISLHGGTSDVVYAQLIFIPNLCLVRAGAKTGTAVPGL